MIEKNPVSKESALLCMNVLIKPFIENLEQAHLLHALIKSFSEQATYEDISEKLADFIKKHKNHQEKDEIQRWVFLMEATQDYKNKLGREISELPFFFEPPLNKSYLDKIMPDILHAYVFPQLTKRDLFCLLFVNRALAHAVKTFKTDTFFKITYAQLEDDKNFFFPDFSSLSYSPPCYLLNPKISTLYPFKDNEAIFFVLNLYEKGFMLETGSADIKKETWYLNPIIQDLPEKEKYGLGYVCTPYPEKLGNFLKKIDLHRDQWHSVKLAHCQIIYSVTTPPHTFAQENYDISIKIEKNNTSFELTRMHKKQINFYALEREGFLCIATSDDVQFWKENKQGTYDRLNTVKSCDTLTPYYFYGERSSFLKNSFHADKKPYLNKMFFLPNGTLVQRREKWLQLFQFPSLADELFPFISDTTKKYPLPSLAYQAIETKETIEKKIKSIKDSFFHYAFFSQPLEKPCEGNSQERNKENKKKIHDAPTPPSFHENKKESSLSKRPSPFH